MLILVTKCNTACFKFPLHARNTYQKVISLDGEQFPIHARNTYQKVICLDGEQFPIHARNTYQKVISLDGEQFPKVAESYGGIGLEAKVAAVMGWGQITPLTEKKKNNIKHCVNLIITYYYSIHCKKKKQRN